MAAPKLLPDTAMPMRDRILDAAERLLGRLGYQKTTMEDLAREASISKRTIYMHFPNKEEVALCSIDRVVERLCDRLQATAASDASAADRLRAMLVQRVLFRCDSVRGYYHSLDDLFASLRPAYMRRRVRYFQAEAQLFARVLQAGIAEGAFRLCDPLDTARTLLTATNSLLPYSLTTRALGQRPVIEKQVTAIAHLLLHGICRGSPRSQRLGKQTSAPV